jgi:hypothetical protein
MMFSFKTDKVLNKKMHDIGKAWPLNPLDRTSMTKKSEKGVSSFMMNQMQKY